MRVFLLSLSIDLHTESTAQTGERAIAGVQHGLIGMGESVTWQGRHFGVMLTHTSRITRYEPPFRFEDRITKGMFASFVHQHTFRTISEGTVMDDELVFAAPLGVLGLIAERVALKKHLRTFLLERNAHLLKVAESEEWRAYIRPDLQPACS